MIKFTISSEKMLKELSSLSGVLVTNPIVPILENFLFDIKDNLLTITASDINTTITTSLEIAHEGGEGRVAVPGRILLDTLKNLPQQPVEFTLDKESYRLTINASTGQYKLAGENALDFPVAPSINNADNITISSSTLKRAIKRTLFAASKDGLRPNLTGIYMYMSSSQTIFVATDGHRLARYIRQDIRSTRNHEIIVPSKPFQVLNQLLSHKEEVISIALNDRYIRFSFGRLSLVATLIDEQYPDYENVIPKENPHQITLHIKEWLSALKRLAIYANKTTQQIKMLPEKSTLTIFAEDIDFSNEAKEEIKCIYQGIDMGGIGFNARLLIDMLNTLSEEHIKIELFLDTPSKAMLLAPKEQTEEEELLLLIMPIILKH